MRYIYMFCLGLSSLFTYKQIYAETNLMWHAFFIPKNAFQKNINSFDVDRVPTVLSDTEPMTAKDVSMTRKSDTSVSQGAIQPPQKSLNITQKRRRAPVSKKISAKRIAKQPEQVSSEVKTSKIEEKQISAKPSPFRLSVEDLEHKSVKDLLAALPYPDFEQPKFKQLYAIYALDLRTLYREGNFLANPEQEEALAKANSVRRFEVR